MIFARAITAISFAISIVALASPTSSSRCKQTCGIGELASRRGGRLNYPFGFSKGCGIRLNCSEEDGAVKIGEFNVLDVTSDNIFVDVPSKCNRPIESIAPLFDRNYALTWQNSLLLQNCTSQAHLTRCMIPTTMVNLQGCDGRSDNLSCYSGERWEGTELLSFGNVTRIQCRLLFSTIIINTDVKNMLSYEMNKVGVPMPV